ncbi:MAG TPA: carboxypeptidase regulatory-like domain-containing protein [Candidatus Acidoferrales bacterium]|nr:carboxypeptidase regulatory-like domain-containing protein [Candidatus Acidoferrales bacterium]
MKFPRILSCAWVLAILACAATPVRGQGDRGSIEGSAVDATGAAVPGVVLQAQNVATGFSYTATSDANGLFTFPVVAVGTYQVEATKAGFATLVRQPVVVTVGARVSLTLTMQVATTQTRVTVSAEAPVVETTRSSVAATVGSEQVANLPVNGRDFMDFILLTPGVTYDTRQGDISFAGQRGTFNSLLVDGSDNNNSFFGQALGRTGSGRAPYQFSEDAVQEFQVNSNSYSAEYGNAAGAVTNVVTKSGTHEFHGSAFWFYRDRSMNANDLVSNDLGRARSPYHFNQFGGTIGGPIKRDRAFFFFDYDGQRNTLPNLVFLNVPPGFTPADNFQRAALNYLAARAASWVRTQNQDVYLGKADLHLTAGQLLSLRWNSQRFTGANFENGGTQNALEHTGASDVTTDSLSATHTWTVSPTVVNEARFNWLRDNEPGLANSDNPEATVRLGGGGAQGGQTVLVVGRNFFSPRFTDISRQEYGDTLTWVRSAHTFKFGADLIHDGIANFFPGNFSGQYTFNSLESFGCSLAGTPCPGTGDLFAQAFAGPGTTGPTTKPNKFDTSYFAQDEWRVRPSFTLNLGLRYDIEFIAQPNTLNPSASLAAAGLRTNFINTDTNNIGPRVGFAWSPLHNDRMVVRGGYGIYYGRTPSILVGTATSNNGLNVQTLSFSGLAMPTYPNNECGAPTASPSCAAPTGGASSAPIIFVFAPDYVEPYIEQGSFGIEYQLAPGTSITVSYLGVRGVHLTRTADINLSPPSAAHIGVANTSTVLTYELFPKARPIAGFSRIEEFQSNSNSIYHGLTVQLNKRFSHQFQLLGSYTFGKVIDDTPDQTSVVPFTFDDAKVVQNSLDIRDDRGPGVNDQRHRFVLSGVWDLNPYAKGLPMVARGFLGGWQLSGVFTGESNQPYSGLVGFDLNGDGNSRTDRTPGLGRDTFYMPKIVDLDFRVTRSVAIREAMRLEFIAEAFNLLNHANIVGVNNTQFSRSTSAAACGIAGTPCLVPNSQFGAPTTTFEPPIAGPRIAQLALKFIF